MFDLKFMTPNGEMKIDPNCSIGFVDQHGTYWSYPANQVSIIKNEGGSNGNGVETLGKLSLRLMSTNEDYIETLKGLVNNKGENE